MSRWRWLPWQRIIKSNYRNSQNYEDDSIIQSAKTTNSDPKNSGNNNKIKIIIDKPAEEDALDFQRYSENLANIISGSTTPQFAVGIFGKWGTGKTTLMRMIERELLDKASDTILTVWFDAWRYEREKYLAVIPFLRQIRIALENDLAKNRKEPSRWDVLRRGLDRTFTAFIESTEFSVAPAGSPVSSTINLKKFSESLKSKGSTYIDGEHIQFHEHVTDYLKAALDKLYSDKDTKGARIVVFVDDLDRCTPEKALEVLESIKAFFDIKGIVYVVGMDSESIDHIIKKSMERIQKLRGWTTCKRLFNFHFKFQFGDLRI
jgi:Cdc6-like AAA superfamily ATPase